MPKYSHKIDLLDTLGDEIEVVGHAFPTPFSWSDTDGPARVQIAYADSGIEALWFNQDQTTALIEALTAARDAVWPKGETNG